MNKKIKIAIVDDADYVHDFLNTIYNNSDIVEMKYSFTDSAKFIKALPDIEFDLCMLDVRMPGMDGLEVARHIGGKPIIFVTGSDDKLPEALELSPIDIVTKPFTRERIDRALEKASRLIMEEEVKYGLFNVAESRKKVCIHLHDIVFVKTDDVDTRNKLVVLKCGLQYTLMNYSLNEILKVAGHLVQVNRQELISVANISEVNSDNVTLKGSNGTCVPTKITLSDGHKQEVSKRMFYNK
ncbi:MAG TPA: LytTR family DNA-binding domain-containing protein [Bacteroidia bacterium]|nr:LytTR family DNA-binding domain-containing protein [Bacteroidia bacterium]